MFLIHLYFFRTPKILMPFSFFLARNSWIIVYLSHGYKIKILTVSRNSRYSIETLLSTAFLLFTFISLNAFLILFTFFVAILKINLKQTSSCFVVSHQSPCLNDPCLNGGTCYSVRGQYDFKCTCPPGLQGKLCNICK